MNRSARYRVRVDETQLSVEINPSGDAPVVTVDGVDLEVRATPDGGFIVREAGQTGQTMIWLDDAGRPTGASVGGRAFDVAVQTAAEAAFEDAMAAAGPGASGSSAIKAPMPGRVVKLLVEVGDDVDADQPVIIVEAMKMENEVAATAPGRVARIEVEAGATVDAGAVLVELEPHPAS